MQQLWVPHHQTFNYIILSTKPTFLLTLAWTFCSMPIWVSYSVKGHEKYKKQKQKFQSFGGNLSLLQNLNMPFSTFQSHIRINEAGNNSPFTTNVENGTLEHIWLETELI